MGNSHISKVLTCTHLSVPGTHLFTIRWESRPRCHLYRYSFTQCARAHSPNVHTICCRHAGQSDSHMDAMCRLSGNFSSADGILLHSSIFWFHAICASMVRNEDRVARVRALRCHGRECGVPLVFAACQNKQRMGVRSHCAATKVLVILSSDRCANRALLKERRARRPDMRERGYCIIMSSPV